MTEHANDSTANGSTERDPLDGFSVQLGATVAGGNGDGPTVEAHQGDDGDRDPFAPAELRTALAANTWKARGAELQQRVLARVRGDEKPVATPWESVNARMGGGLWPGMHVLVGGTGSGKSQWAMQTVMHAAAVHGVPSLVLSLELDALGVFARGAAIATGQAVEGGNDTVHRVAWSSFYTGGHHRDEARAASMRADIEAALPVASAALEALPVHWYEAPPHGLSHMHLRAIAGALRELHPEHAGPVLVVLDFLQLVAGADAREDSVTRVSRAAYQCRAIARELGAVVLVLSSTSRDGGATLTTYGKALAEAREKDKRPPYAGELVGLGKESGDVEYSADSVMVLVRERVDDVKHQGGDPVHLAVAKLRAGAPGWCELRFNGTRFRTPPGDAPVGPPQLWCDNCDAYTRPHPAEGGGVMCGACGGPLGVVDASDAGDEPVAVVAPAETPKRGGRHRGGKR